LLPSGCRLLTSTVPTIKEIQQLACSTVYQLKLHIQYLEDSFGLNTNSTPSEVSGGRYDRNEAQKLYSVRSTALWGSVAKNMTFWFDAPDPLTIVTPHGCPAPV
jgi:hypothetical protein